MTEIPARELRNDVSAVLRRVEAGERLTITVSGRPVADLVPRDTRPRTMSREQYLEWFGPALADPGLAKQLKEIVPDTTDDMQDPWERWG